MRKAVDLTASYSGSYRDQIREEISDEYSKEITIAEPVTEVLEEIADVVNYLKIVRLVYPKVNESEIIVQYRLWHDSDSFVLSKYPLEHFLTSNSHRLSQSAREFLLEALSKYSS